LPQDVETSILEYVTEPQARVCCQAWHAHLFVSLNLERRVCFHRMLTLQKSVKYTHSVNVDFGHDYDVWFEDFGQEEDLCFQFEFYADGTYKMMFEHIFRSWTSRKEKQIGTWEPCGDNIKCCTVAAPRDEPDEPAFYAPPGRTFEIPIVTVASGSYSGGPSASWEDLARGKPASPMGAASSDQALLPARIYADPNHARVAIDEGTHPHWCQRGKAPRFVPDLMLPLFEKCHAYIFPCMPMRRTHKVIQRRSSSIE